MRELTCNEMSDVSGGFGLLSIPAAIGFAGQHPDDCHRRDYRPLYAGSWLRGDGGRHRWHQPCRRGHDR